jgi:hypothetical protein
VLCRNQLLWVITQCTGTNPTCSQSSGLLQSFAFGLEAPCQEGLLSDSPCKERGSGA